ncbi:MAG: CDP-alcohol phosphatidyltransferase family protein [Pirellulales bacterium]|nr:CDP-alcohol phosphatidyltransferase family protein [Pirellulales bacterium]
MADEQNQSADWLTLPNMITLIRIVGSPVLVVLAIVDQISWLAGLAVLLVFTEWLDGFLARRLRVTSSTGARLDTVADAIFYSSLLLAVVLLRPQMVAQEKIWIVVAVASYLLSWLASGIKFHRLPSYHTWAAKGVWLIVGAGIVCLLADLSPWPFRVAMVCVALTNLEAICITWVLPKCRVDVPTLLHARRLRNHPPD